MALVGKCSDLIPSTSSPSLYLWHQAWQSNKGAILVLGAVAIAACMDAIARFVQQGAQGMHPFQVIVARMSVTLVLSSSYLWHHSIPDFPLGNREERPWLILRAVFGYGGAYCLYYSIRYLPLAEATVIRFLVPLVTAIASAVVLRQAYTAKEFFAGVIALGGVVIIAHPRSIFGDGASTKAIPTVTPVIKVIDTVTPAQRLIAIGVALLGVLGAGGAYTVIRVIGNRAHPLLSVNYFAFLSTLLSTLALLFIPGIHFSMPSGALEWALLLLIGVLGFVLQFMLTAGLTMDRSSKATSMLYMQVLFAGVLDLVVWGVLPGRWSVVGAMIVVGSTLWSALQKGGGTAVNKTLGDEETPLLRERVHDEEGK